MLVGRIGAAASRVAHQRVLEHLRLGESVGRDVARPLVLIALRDVIGLADVLGECRHVLLSQLRALGGRDDLLVSTHARDHVVEQLIAVLVEQIERLEDARILVSYEY